MNSWIVDDRCPYSIFEWYLLVKEHVGIVVVLSRYLVERPLSALAAGIAAIILVVAHTDLLSFAEDFQILSDN